MKKFYMLIGAALTAATAMAVIGHQNAQVSNLTSEKADVQAAEKVSQDRALFRANALGTRAGETVGDAKVTSPLMNLSFGASTTGYAYTAASFGLLPAWGTVTFGGSAADATEFTWDWNNGYDPSSQYYKTFTQKGQNLTVDLTPANTITDLTLTAVNGEASSIGAPIAVQYVMGAKPAYYGYKFTDGTEPGATMYPCTRAGSLIGYMCYSKLATDASDYTNGVYNGWKDVLPKMTGQGTADDYTNLKINAFASEIPAQSSPYMFTQMWGWFYVSITDDTTLTGGIYTIDENGTVSNKPIGLMKSNVSKTAGETGAYLTFDVVPVDEDGDEIDGNLIVDNTAIFIKIDDFNNNSAVEELMPVYGKNNTYGLNEKDPYYNTAYAYLQYDYNGQTYNKITRCPYNYYYDNNKTALFGTDYYYWMIDAVFPYVINNETGGRDFNVEIPVAGGQKNVTVEPYYYQIKLLVDNDMMAVDVDGEWLSYEISAADSSTGLSTITVKGTALPSGTAGRTGAIKFTGYAQDFTINVTQGTPEAGVGEIVVDSEAATVYYDLQGRKVVGTPDKGIYIVKEGNKAKKVVL